MARLRDPEGLEAKNLLRSSQLAGKDVLEIGCGEGWLTCQFADASAKVMGIDPGYADLQQAKTHPSSRGANVFFTQSMGERLPFVPGAFDVVLFSNSL